MGWARLVGRKEWCLFLMSLHCHFPLKLKQKSQPKLSWCWLLGSKRFKLFPSSCVRRTSLRNLRTISPSVGTPVITLSIKRRSQQRVVKFWKRQSPHGRFGPLPAQPRPMMTLSIILKKNLKKASWVMNLINKLFLVAQSSAETLVKSQFYTHSR